MNKTPTDNPINSDPLEREINQALDDSIENLSPEIRRQLNRARITATEKRHSRLFWLPVASAMSVALAVLIGWQLVQKPVPEETIFAEVLQEDLDMLEELEFAYWIAEEFESAQL